MAVSRGDVLAFRTHTQGLTVQGPADDAAVLDLGVQDTGPDGARWALEIRGCTASWDDLVLAWTLRGAPHAYRRREIAGVAAATAPQSEADAAKRVFGAAGPLKKAGIPVLEGLATVAAEMRTIVEEPTVKGQLSSRLTEVLDPPYLRRCNPCDATHSYEQTFRLSALQAGLELEPDTSPPVLHRIPGWAGPAGTFPDRLDPVRGYLHLLGPSTPKLVAGYVDAPVRDIRAHWPEDVVEVEVEGQALDVLAEDANLLTDPPTASRVLLLGPFDLFLQGRDRELVVRGADHRKDLWRTLGRPGAVLNGHEVVGTWRPRSSGRRLRLAVDMWDGGARPRQLDDAAERLAAHRGVEFAGYV